MNKIVFQLLLLPLLGSCNGRYNGKNAVLQVGDSIATIDNVTYYWQQFSEDSSRISAVKENSVVNECVVKGPAHGAIQCDDGNIYIQCNDGQLIWFDIRYFPDKLGLLTEEEWENYDPAQEGADAIIYFPGK